jgi:hypothetical protein
MGIVDSEGGNRRFLSQRHNLCPNFYPIKANLAFRLQ